jgi:hypothetical protein
VSEDKHPGGRPLKFKSAKELQAKIDEYYSSCFEEWWYQDKGGSWHQRIDRNGESMMIQSRPFTISGLAYHLGTNRQTLLNYEEKDEFVDTITHAKSRIENYVEEQLFDKEARNTNAIQFNLSNNFKKWAVKQEIDQTNRTVVIRGEGDLED